tara:strand:+ start:3960 stop:4562 length:603 start_codon:yes stop_codon:yes gene_type:complete
MIEINTLKIEKINNELEEIRDLLVQYLKTSEVKKEPKFSKFIEQEIKSYKSVHVVNFNYTNTIEQYLTDGLINEAGQEIKIHYIHGKLDNKSIIGNENIIFGFGNDKDKLNEELRNSGNSTYLKHFKTFGYLMSREYSNVLNQTLNPASVNRFESDGTYHVKVFGHSLALTDKTLLHSILGRKECEKIHLYPREDKKDNP